MPRGHRAGAPGKGQLALQNNSIIPSPRKRPLEGGSRGKREDLRNPEKDQKWHPPCAPWRGEARHRGAQSGALIVCERTLPPQTPPPGTNYKALKKYLR